MTQHTLPHLEDAHLEDARPEGAGPESLISRLESAPGFAVLHRPAKDATTVQILIGEPGEVTAIADIPVLDHTNRDATNGAHANGLGANETLPVLAAIGFRQITERGFDVIDDQVPILTLRATEQITVDLAELLQLLPDGPHSFLDNGFDVSDDDYAATVRAVLDEEIATGAGSNFVIHRCLTGQIDLNEQSRARSAVGVLKRLLSGERNAYWTFLLHTPQTTLVGATPERHVSLKAGVVTMNPISGTLRHPATGWADENEQRAALAAFLDDAKERDELAMVVDEELKMMAAITEDGGRVHGPYLKPMAHLTHTEYVIEGRTTADVRDILRATMFAPTVTGGPIRNACRVIARHENRGRRYYGGVLALIDTDPQGRPRLDAPILIRTAEIAPDGRVRVAAGATLVRGSTPESELAETRSKAAGIMSALTGSAIPVQRSVEHGLSTKSFAELLAGRNRNLARHWLQSSTVHQPIPPIGRQVQVVNAEDDFTAMLGHLLRAQGFTVVEHSWEELSGQAGDQLATTFDPVVLGPGPGDPGDLLDRRMRALRSIALARLTLGLPMLGICLGHQILSLTLGFEVSRLPAPDQGRQRSIDFFGERHRVGFYNSYAVRTPNREMTGIRLSADETGQYVHALRGRNLAGLQFHPESVLTTQGGQILGAELARLTGGTVPVKI